jgi:hypothetical protein
MMEAARTSETLVNFYRTTWHYNQEDSHLRTHRHENLKSYKGGKLVDSTENSIRAEFEHPMSCSFCGAGEQKL